MHRGIAVVCLLACAGAVSAQQTNPALREQPVLEDPRHAADQARLNRIHQSAGATLESRLGTAGALDCALDEDTVWRLAQLATRAQYEASLAGLAQDTRPAVTAVEAAIVEGDCANGAPEGDFTAVTRFETRTETQFGAVGTQDRRRVTGTMRDGRLQGELVFSMLSRVDTAAGGRPIRSTGHHVARFEDGVQVGHATGIGFSYDDDGLSQVVTSVARVEAPGVVHTKTWAGSMLSGENATVNGVLHGWHVSHPVQYLGGVQGRLAPRMQLTRICYQNGSPAGDAACGVAAAPAGAAQLYHERPRLRGAERALLQELVEVTQRVVPGTQQAFDEAQSPCELSGRAQDAIVYGGSAEAFRQRGDARIEVRLLRGDCADGLVEGPMEALLRIEDRPGGAAETRVTVSRATGEMRGNRRHGRWVSARTVSSASSPDQQTYTLADYDHDALAGSRISFIRGDTLVERPTREAGVFEAEYYLGDFLRERFVTRDGVRDGTATVYVRNDRNVVRCFRNGVMAHEGACRRR